MGHCGNIGSGVAGHVAWFGQPQLALAIAMATHMTGYAFNFLLLFLVDMSSSKSTHFVTHGSQQTEP
jgi:hypothetical protein